MTLCKAFDDSYNPCLNYTDHSHIVCKDHQGFYQASNWFHRYPLNPSGEDDYFSFSSDKLKKVYKTAILEGHIKITQEHFRDLVVSGKPLESLIDYYLLCCLQPGVDPLWSINLFHQTCKEIVFCHTEAVYPLVQQDKNFLYRFLDPLFNNKERTFDLIFYYILWNITSCEHIWKVPFDVPIHLDNPTVSLIQYIKAHPKFSNEFLWKDSIHYENMMNLISTKQSGMRLTSRTIMKFLQSIPDLRNEQKFKQKMAFQEKAGEIVAVAWAPKRVRKWCLSLEEGTAMDNRWPLSRTSDHP